MPTAFPLEPSKFHHALAADLDGLSLGGRRGELLNQVAPRDSAKTTVASFTYVLREALEKREPYILLTSETERLAWRYLRRIRDAVEFGEGVRRHYPDQAGRGPVWTHDALELKNGVRIEARGTGANIRGSLHRDRRPTLILVDDPHDRQTIYSATTRERDWQWLTYDLLSAGEPGHTNVVHLGTTLHREAIACRLQQTPGWTSRVYKAVCSWPDRMDLWREWEVILTDPRLSDDDRRRLSDEFYAANRDEMHRGAEVLWEAREPLLWLMRHRAAIGPAAFAAEKDSNPHDPSACEWPPEYFDHPLFWFDEFPAKLLVRILALDPSKGRGDRHGDDSAWVRYGYEQTGAEYVESDQRNDRNAAAIVAAGVEHVREFKPDFLVVEANTFQELFAPLLRAEFERQGVPLPRLELVTNTTAKEVRIRRLTTPLAARRMRFKARSPGTQKLVQQLKDFPNGEHDDGPDCLQLGRDVAVKVVNAITAARGRQ